MWMGYILLTISRKMKTSWIKHTKKCFRKHFEGHSNRKWFNVDIIYCVTETCKVYFFSCVSLGVQEVRDYNYVILGKFSAFQSMPWAENSGLLRCYSLSLSCQSLLGATSSPPIPWNSHALHILPCTDHSDFQALPVMGRLLHVIPDSPCISLAARIPALNCTRIFHCSQHQLGQ